MTPQFTQAEQIAICEALMAALGLQDAFDPACREASGSAYTKVLAAAWSQRP